MCGRTRSKFLIKPPEIDGTDETTIKSADETTTESADETTTNGATTTVVSETTTAEIKPPKLGKNLRKIIKGNNNFNAKSDQLRIRVKTKYRFNQ